MKTLDQIAKDLEEGREAVADAYRRAKQRGVSVPVRPEELRRLAELCSRELPPIARLARTAAHGAPTEPAAATHPFIRC
ncbi:MAG TPA: hypothetical protein VGG39_17780 [Polyangiaceae bacterium]